MVKCPFCGFENNIEPFKQIRSSWKFRFYTVKMLKCPKCNGVFNYYEGISTKGRQSIFVVRVKPKVKR